MQIIPLLQEDSQSLSVVLAQQNCKLNIYQKSMGLFLDLLVNGSPIIQTKICRDRVKLVRYPYLGFIGDLCFMDTEGVDDPQSTGLGSRWVLMYLEAGIDV